jgi:hypothetical protein
MKFTDKHPWTDHIRRVRWAVICLCLAVGLSCTSRQAYEGFKAGHRSGCLEYPESEYLAHISHQAPQDTDKVLVFF